MASELENICKSAGIKIKSVYVSNPVRFVNNDRYKYVCILKYETRSLIVQLGRGNNEDAPTAADVLNCLKSDASAADESFADWCSSFGYDPDSMRARGIYDACLQADADLKALFITNPGLLQRIRQAEH